MDEKMFSREMQLDEAKTREEALKILRTDPDLTEERAQKMAALCPEEESEKDGPEKGFTELLVDALLCEDPQQREAIWQEAYKMENERIRKQGENK